MEPDTFRDINRAGEAWPIVDLNNNFVVLAAAYELLVPSRVVSVPLERCQSMLGLRFTR
jgi:hypothetical protein